MRLHKVLLVLTALVIIVFNTYAVIADVEDEGPMVNKGEVMIEVASVLHGIQLAYEICVPWGLPMVLCQEAYIEVIQESLVKEDTI
jgi:hypothetical protein